jgi:CubicO group peptidase (beta-lactamase class C family)
MTSTLAAMAVDEGRISWTTNLGGALPEITEMNPEWRLATLEELLEHRAGAPADLDRFWPLFRIEFSSGSPSEKRLKVVKQILSKPPVYKPGSQYVYSSLDYFVVCTLLEKLYGKSSETLIQQRLWNPIGILGGSFGAPGRNGELNQPWGHWGMFVTGHPVKPDGFVARLTMPLYYGPIGASQMTIGDWAKFISLHLRGDPENPNRQVKLITPASFAALHMSKQGSFYESGWILTNKDWANGRRHGDTGRIISSQGDNGFWHCEAWIAPEIDSAFLVVCNQGGPSPDKAASIACNKAVELLANEFTALPK